MSTATAIDMASSYWPSNDETTADANNKIRGSLSCSKTSRRPSPLPSWRARWARDLASPINFLRGEAAVGVGAESF